ncbi:MAG: FG-GAP-like repeat-containing protein [Pseudomonadota bacterium]
MNRTALIASLLLLSAHAGTAFGDGLIAQAKGGGPTCDEADSVGGGAAGVSPGPVGPPNSLGWDVGGGQCNGDFTVAFDAAFPGGALEIGLRAEERRRGQVSREGDGDYTVQTGPDTTAPIATDRAWWNFNISIARDGTLADLDALTLEIRTDVGPNEPSAPSFDLLAIRGLVDARNSPPNATVSFSDLLQLSQNPEFGWFDPAADADANPNGNFDYDAPGAWRFRVTAIEGTSMLVAEICIRTPGEDCDESVFTNIGVSLPEVIGEAEGVSNQEIVVARDNNTADVTVLITEVGGTAVPGEDFVSVDGTTVSFAAGGDFVKRIDFATINDDIIEADEDFTFAFSTTASDVTFTRASQVVTIVDDDMLPPPPMPDLAQVIVRRSDTSRWRLYLFDGFTPIEDGNRAFTQDPAWTTRAVTDLNEDGVRDLLLRNDSTGEWQVYYLDGPTGEILDRQDIALSLDLADVFQAAGDMNGDGLGDVLTRHAVTGDWTAWYLLEDGALALSQPLAIVAPATAQTRGLGDLDGDGGDELLLRDSVDNSWTSVDFAAGSGDVVGSQSLVMTPQTAWRFEGIGDLDGDGFEEVLLRRTDNGRWRSYDFDGTGAAIDSARIRMTPREVWTLQQLGDFDRDGRTDALLRRSDNVRWFLYRLDGRAILDSGRMQLTPNLLWETQ